MRCLDDRQHNSTRSKRRLAWPRFGAPASPGETDLIRWQLTCVPGQGSTVAQLEPVQPCGFSAAAEHERGARPMRKPPGPEVGRWTRGKRAKEPCRRRSTRLEFGQPVGRAMALGMGDDAKLELSREIASLRQRLASLEAEARQRPRTRARTTQRTPFENSSRARSRRISSSPILPSSTWLMPPTGCWKTLRSSTSTTQQCACSATHGKSSVACGSTS